MTDIRIFLSGCSGRMGQEISRISSESQDLSVIAGFDIRSAATSFPIYTKMSECSEEFDVIVDFSHTSALPDLLALASHRKKPAVLCTTGYSPEEREMIRRAAEDIPLFTSGNMSLGINLLVAISKKAASILYPEFDIEILEAHHRNKLDAPSGTALMLADAICEELGEDLEYVYERQSVRKKREGKELGIHSIRAGSIIGDHSVIFGGEEETITLTHSAQSRNVFARGAVAAARFIVSQKAGLYSMSDLIG